MCYCMRAKELGMSIVVRARGGWWWWTTTWDFAIAKVNNVNNEAGLTT